jgi:hypothetical protein
MKSVVEGHFFLLIFQFPICSFLPLTCSAMLQYFLGPFQLHLLVGPRLSPSAAEAASAGQIWEMFFTEEILNIIVEKTNR